MFSFILSYFNNNKNYSTIYKLLNFRKISPPNKLFVNEENQNGVAGHLKWSPHALLSQVSDAPACEPLNWTADHALDVS
jgi:hypothetical protein